MRVRTRARAHTHPHTHTHTHKYRVNSAIMCDSFKHIGYNMIDE